MSRSIDDGAGQADAFAHAAGKFRRPLLLDAFQVDQVQDLLDAPVDFCLSERSFPLENEGDVVLHVQGIEERGPLEKHAKLAADGQQLPLIEAGNVDAPDEDFPGVGREQADQVLEQHTFAPAADADNGQSLAFFHRESHAAEDRERAEILFHIAHLDDHTSKRLSTSVKKKLLMRMVMEE